MKALLILATHRKFIISIYLFCLENVIYFVKVDGGLYYHCEKNDAISAKVTRWFFCGNMQCYWLFRKISFRKTSWFEKLIFLYVYSYIASKSYNTIQYEFNLIYSRLLQRCIYNNVDVTFSHAFKAIPGYRRASK